MPRRLYVPATLLALICSLVMLLALKLPPPAAGGGATRAIVATQDIAFVGDSITRGYYASDVSHRYANLAASQLNLSAWVDGTPGITAVEVAADFAAILPPQTVVPSDARIIVVELGTNDVRAVSNGTETLQQFQDAYTSVIGRLQHDVPSAQLVCLGTWRPPTVGVPDSGAAYDTIISQLCGGAGHYAALGDLYADNSYHGPAGVSTYFGTSDTFHPNDAGHQAIANRTSALISFLLNGGAAISQ